jgi:hypothetical protein
MISEIANDLLTRVRTISDLSGTTSFAIGGKAADPSLKEISLPACRLILIQDYVDEDPMTRSSHLGPEVVPKVQQILFTFSALVIVPYEDDISILNTQFPLLESVITTVHGEAPTPLGGAHRWRYIGQKLSFVYPDRLGYEQRYTVNGPL